MVEVLYPYMSSKYILDWYTDIKFPKNQKPIMQKHNKIKTKKPGELLFNISPKGGIDS